MSGTSMTHEMLLLSEAFGWGLDEMRWVTVNALKSSFLPFNERLALIEQVVKPAYAALAAEHL
jgi:adenosine deaminase